MMCSVVEMGIKEEKSSINCRLSARKHSLSAIFDIMKELYASKQQIAKEAKKH